MASEQSRSEIQKTYIAYYGRPADEEGLEYWAGLLDEAGGDLSVIIDAFANSPEFLESFGDLEDSELINNLYQQLFGEDADSGGLDFYVRLIQQGERTLGSVALDILNGAENEHAEIINNKFAYAQQVTLSIKVKNKQYDGDSAISLKLKIKNIGASDESLEEALAALDGEIDDFDDAPGNSGDAGKGSDNSLHHLELEDGAQEIVTEEYGNKLKIKNFGSDDVLILPEMLLQGENDDSDADDEALEETTEGSLVEAEDTPEEVGELGEGSQEPEEPEEEEPEEEESEEEEPEEEEPEEEESEEEESEEEEGDADLVLDFDAVAEDLASFFAADKNNKITFSWDSDSDSDEDDDDTETNDSLEGDDELEEGDGLEEDDAAEEDDSSEEELDAEEGEVVDDSEDTPEPEAEDETLDYHLNVKIHYDGGFIQLHKFVITDEEAFDFSRFDDIGELMIRAQDDMLTVDFGDDGDGSIDYDEYQNEALELLELIGIQFGESVIVEPEA